MYIISTFRYIMNWWSRENYGPVGSNTDIGSKRGVQCENTTTLYLAFMINNLLVLKFEFEFY